MPRKTINDYVFYKFVCNDENIKCCYVGSTANFSDRKRHHFDAHNNQNSDRYNYKIYETIRANGGWENWKMVIIGEAKEISLTQSRILEQKYIDELEEKLNMCRAYRSAEDLAEDRKIIKQKTYNKYKEQILEKQKEYREANKEKITEQKKAEYEKNIEKYKERNKANYEKNKEKILEKQKEYSEANKEKIAEKNKEWREANKEKIKAYREANKDKINEQHRLNRLKKKEEKNNV